MLARTKKVCPVWQAPMASNTWRKVRGMTPATSPSSSPLSSPPPALQPPLPLLPLAPSANKPPSMVCVLPVPV